MTITAYPATGSRLPHGPGWLHTRWRQRGLVACLTLTILCGGAAVSARAQAPSPAAATAFVDTTARAMIAIIDSSQDSGSETRQLQAIVDQAVDAEGIARFCLGRYWPMASPAQRAAFLSLFHAVLLDGVAGQIRTYKGVTVTLGRAEPHDADVSVSSVVRRPDNGPANVDWVVERTGSGLKIEDIVAEGTSMRLTRRNDYAAFLAGHGGNVDALLAAMRQRLAR